MDIPLTKILWVLGVALILFGVKAMLDQKTLRGSTLRVTAEILEVAPSTLEARLPRAARVTIRYEINGTVYRSSQTATDKFWSSVKPGDHVELVVDEKNPGKFIRAVTQSRAGYFGYALIASGVVVCAIAIFKR